MSRIFTISLTCVTTGLILCALFGVLPSNLQSITNVETAFADSSDDGSDGGASDGEGEGNDADDGDSSDDGSDGGASDGEGEGNDADDGSFDDGGENASSDGEGEGNDADDGSFDDGGENASSDGEGEGNDGPDDSGESDGGAGDSESDDGDNEGSSPIRSFFKFLNKSTPTPSPSPQIQRTTQNAVQQSSNNISTEELISQLVQQVNKRINTSLTRLEEVQERIDERGNRINAILREDNSNIFIDFSEVDRLQIETTILITQARAKNRFNTNQIIQDSETVTDAGEMIKSHLTKEVSPEVKAITQNLKKTIIAFQNAVDGALPSNE